MGSTKQNVDIIEASRRFGLELSLQWTAAIQKLAQIALDVLSKAIYLFKLIIRMAGGMRLQKKAGLQQGHWYPIFKKRIMPQYSTFVLSDDRSFT